MKFRATIIAMLFALTGGCVTAPVHVATDLETRAIQGSQSTGQATIYVYRGSSGAGAMWPFAVLIDDVEIGSIRSERYLPTNVAPGTHVVKVHCKGMCDLPDIAIQGNFFADRSYHFLTNPDIRFGWSQSAFVSTLIQVEPDHVPELQRAYSLGKAEQAGK
jgi:hypothetical protein